MLEFTFSKLNSLIPGTFSISNSTRFNSNSYYVPMIADSLITILWRALHYKMSPQFSRLAFIKMSSLIVLNWFSPFKQSGFTSISNSYFSGTCFISDPNTNPPLATDYFAYW